MAWYKTGTVSLVNGVATVAGAGTDWINGAGVGEGFVAPDGKIYEIASIQSATQLTLGTDYYGPTASAQAYQIIPSQSYMRDLANQVATLVNSYADVANITGAGKFSNGTTAAPAIRFIDDENTGLNHSTADTLELVTGATARLTASGSGVLIPTTDINGGTIDGAVVGSTTPAAGSFTTLSASSAVTVADGFDVRWGDGSTFIAGNSSSDVIQLAAAGTERARVTSSGLAVTGALSASGGVTASVTSASSSSIIRSNNSGGNGTLLWKQGSSSAVYGVMAAESGALFNSSGDLCIVNDAAGKNIIFANNTAANERMRLDAFGNLTLSAGTLGYGVGAGGTVTQATSKSTAVTLHKPCGQITMNNAALAAGAVVSFTLTNSFVGLGDGVIINIVETVASTNYQVWAGIGSGTVKVNLRNISAGSLSDSVVVNFQVVKGATS